MNHTAQTRKPPALAALWGVAAIVLLIAVIATVPSATGALYHLPRFWPGLAVALMIVGAATVFAEQLLRGRSRAQSPESAAEPADSSSSSEDEVRQPWAHALIVAAIIGYIAVIGPLGFIISTCLLFFCIASIMRAQRRLRVLLVSVLVGVVTAYFFGNILSVPLPRGLGALADLSRLIY